MNSTTLQVRMSTQQKKPLKKKGQFTDWEKILYNI